MDASERAKHLGAALRCLEAGHWRQAEVEARAVLAHHPMDVDGLLMMGLTVAAMGEPARAAPTLDRVMRERPDYAHPCDDLACLQPALPRSLVAAQYRACLRLAPGNNQLRRTFAAFLLENDAAAEAVTVLVDGLESASAFNLMGMALADLGRFKEAIQHFEQAVRLDPGPAVGWANLGMVLKVERRFDEGLAAYEQAIARTPRDAQIRVNRAVALLQAGRWSEAWEDYEWRLRLTQHSPLPPDHLMPSLSSLGDDLSGITVVATHEEGYGDTIQFMRYLPLLAERGAKVVAMVPRPLERLMRGLSRVSTVLGPNASVPSYDYHCPFFSLPRVFETSVADIPAQTYLAADRALAAKWRAKLPASGFRVGLVWAGQARPWLPGFEILERRRSAGLAALAPLGELEGVAFVSLQMGHAAEQARNPPIGLQLTNPMGEVADFADTAAIIDGLDLVISVDTSVVHLAGAMGKPVFLLDRYDNCWRWLSGRTDSPWYPNLTIFRQEEPGDWSVPVARVAEALKALVAVSGTTAAELRPSPKPELADAA
jgi:tetratricopeptide (TPR) repeat protein